MSSTELQIIGRKDKADFPHIHLQAIEVKIDSGAYSCSIHCESIELEIYQGKECLAVIFLDKSHPQFNGEKYFFENYKKKLVKSSTGESQLRYFIQLTIDLFDREFCVDFSLTRRNGLKHPVLLGRKLLNKHFLIDTSKTNLSYRSKQKRLKLKK
jgi:hypothetical protein